MSTDRRVRKIMETDPVRLAASDPIRRAIAAMVERSAHAALVIDDAGGLAGLLTEKDCFRPALHASYYQEWRTTVADHMTREVVAIEAGDDVVRAAEMFVEHRFRILPVLDEGRPVGLLDRSAVLKELFSGG